MKTTIITAVLTIVLVSAIVALARSGESRSAPAAANVQTSVNGKQIVEVTAKGGYSPRITVAKAGVPTIIRVKTSGTYDCSSALTIPSLNYRTNLPPSGDTDIEIPPQTAGSVLRGLCAMGMYNFAVKFD